LQASSATEVAAAVAAEAAAMEKAAGRVMEAQVEAGPEAEASAVVTAAVAEVGVARVAAADVLAAHREWRAETTGEAGKEEEEVTAAATLAVEVRVAAEGAMAMAAVETVVALRVMEAQVEAGPEAEASAVETAAVAQAGVARVAAADVLAAHRGWRAGTTGVAGPAEKAPVTAAVSEGAAAGLVKLLKATAEGSLTMEAVVGYFQVARASVHR